MPGREDASSSVHFVRDVQVARSGVSLILSLNKTEISFGMGASLFSVRAVRASVAPYRLCRAIALASGSPRFAQTAGRSWTSCMSKMPPPLLSRCWENKIQGPVNHCFGPSCRGARPAPGNWHEDRTARADSSRSTRVEFREFHAFGQMWTDLRRK